MKLVLSEVGDDATAEWKYDDEVGEWVDGVETPFKSYRAMAVVDGEVLADHIVDLGAFAYAWKTGEDTITTVFTCTCGHSGCAGYDDDFKIQKRGDRFLVSIVHKRDENTKVDWDSFTVDLDRDFPEMIEKSNGPEYQDAHSLDFNEIYDEVPEWVSLSDAIDRYVRAMKDWKAHTANGGNQE